MKIDQRAERRPTDFEGFYESHYPRLTQALLLMTGHAHEAEDIAQEAMLRALERWPRVRQMESPLGYVYTTAFNLNRNRLRRASRRIRGLRHHDDQDVAERVTARDEAVEALRSLTAAQREALLLVEWAGLTPDEAADVLGVEPTSVRTRLHRARAAIQREVMKSE